MTTEASSPRARRAVIASDDNDARLFLRIALTDAGFQVAEARDGEELFEMLLAVPQHHFDIVVTDHRMPRLFGMEVLARAGSRAPFIIVSGEAADAARDAATRLGAVAFLSKPVDLATLLRLIETATRPRGEG